MRAIDGVVVQYDHLLVFGGLHVDLDAVGAMVARPRHRQQRVLRDVQVQRPSVR